MNTIRTQLAAALLHIRAVTLRPEEPYTWTSGVLAPVYTDNRLTLSHPAVRSLIARGLADVIAERAPGAECLAGAATGGIAHAALAADRLGLPMAYVRASAKAHGKQNLVEGRILQGQRVVVIEDTVSTGGSVLAAVEGVRAAGGEVPLVAAIFAYGFAECRAAFCEAGVELATLTDFDAVVDAGLAQGRLTEAEAGLLRTFRADPRNWQDSI
jgi:orotate phosphoribosyltransferase